MRSSESKELTRSLRRLRRLQRSGGASRLPLAGRLSFGTFGLSSFGAWLASLGAGLTTVGGAVTLPWIAGGVTALLIPAALITLPIFDRNGAVASAIVAAVTNPASLFAARSPGARGPGALTQTKLARAVPLPKERVLSQGRNRPIAIPGEIPFVQDASLVPVAFTDFPDLPGTPLVYGPLVPPVINGPPPGGPFVPPGGPYVPPTPPPVVSAVPEPATWAMAILGFFLVGTAIRRRPRIADRRAPAI